MDGARSPGACSDAATEEQAAQPAEAAEPARRPRAPELVLVGAGPGSQSLQERFIQFKRERRRERALVQRGGAAAVATPARARGERDVNSLRQQFVHACLSYIGVPYSKKSHAPGEQDYEAPLFLDCCGLVRRAVQDLKEEFGFSIGHWNQSYQFETLPIEIAFEELRPGDLIFVEGVYYDERKKPQRHNIVHVEVFIGGESGEATVGSRWARSDPSEGKVRGVQVHPSYRYTSKKYDIKKYHFRSLVTWLQGTCRAASYPCVPSTLAVPCGGKSIFEVQQEGQSGDEADAKDCTPDPYGESPVFYVGEGNNWRVVAEALERRGWRRLPFEAAFSCRFDLKWVEQRAKIDYRRHVEGQLVNHIPNNDVLTSKALFLRTVRAHEDATAERFDYHPSSYSSERPADRAAALAEAESAPEAIWILKPSRGLGGAGIELVQGAAALHERLLPPPRDLALERAVGPKPTEGWVVQRYIDRPLLLAGRKFDVRAYCLVARTAPHLWLFHPGYCKVALEPYDSALDNRFAHLTNACVQRGHPEYQESLRGKHIWSQAEAEAELVRAGKWSAEQGQFWPRVHEEMKLALAWLFEASCSQLERRRGYFDLLGVDFLLDGDLRLHLLEVNSNPAMFFDSSDTLRELVPRLVGASLDLVLEAQRPGREESTPAAPVPFELLADEASGFVFGRAAS